MVVFSYRQQGFQGGLFLFPVNSSPVCLVTCDQSCLPGVSAKRKSKCSLCLAMAEGTACRGNFSAPCLSEAWNRAGNQSKSDLPVSIQLCLISKTAVMLAQGRALADQLSWFTVQEKARESFHFNGKVVLQYINKVYSEILNNNHALSCLFVFLSGFLVSFPVEGLCLVLWASTKGTSLKNPTSSCRTRSFLWMWLLLSAPDIAQVELSTELDLKILQAPVEVSCVLLSSQANNCFSCEINALL